MAHTFLQTVQTFATCYDYHLFYDIFLFAFTNPINEMPLEIIGKPPRRPF